MNVKKSCCAESSTSKIKFLLYWRRMISSYARRRKEAQRWLRRLTTTQQMKNQTSQYGSYLIFDVLESFLQSAAPEISSCQSMSRGKLLVLKKFRYVLNIHGLQLLIIDYKIEIHTGYMPILVLCIIPHISSAICNLTGFCNGSGITGQPFQIKSNSQFFILIQLTLQRSAGFFLS